MDIFSQARCVRVQRCTLILTIFVLGLLWHSPGLADSDDEADNVINYEFAGKQYYGYLAKPPSQQKDTDKKGSTADSSSVTEKAPALKTKKVPGILLVHDAYGHSSRARAQARRLAEQGYIVFAVDMYGDKRQANSAREANIRATDLLSERREVYGLLMAAHRILSNLPGVDVDKVGALGYCLGGGVVLSAVESGAKLAAAVSVSGDLNYPESDMRFGDHKAPLLILQGGADSVVPSDPDALMALKTRLENASSSFQWITYPGADHGFHDARASEEAMEFNAPSNYHGEAAEKAWQALTDFFEANLKRSL